MGTLVLALEIESSKPKVNEFACICKTDLEVTKAIRFYQRYCKRNNLKGKIVKHEYKKEFLDTDYFFDNVYDKNKNIKNVIEL